MRFGEAVTAMECGQKVRRACWSGEVFLRLASGVKTSAGVELEPFIFITYGTDQPRPLSQPFTPSDHDILGHDWEAWHDWEALPHD